MEKQRVRTRFVAGFLFCSFIATLLLAAPAGCGYHLFPLNGFRPCPPATSQPTTIILVRHAERDPGDDPPLTTEGMTRAQNLALALADAGVTAIYCTDLIRNRDTAQPLAMLRGLTLNLVDESRYADTPRAAAEIIADIQARYAGGVVLFVGNIGSSRFGGPGINQELYRQLGGTGTPPIRYRDLYVITVYPAGNRFIYAAYGGASSLDSN